MNEGKHAMKHYRNTRMTLALLGSLALAAPACAQQRQEAPARHYQVAPGPLSTALSAFAAEAGVSISGAASLYAGLHSRGLNGSYQVADGFARLLDGSGLVAIEQGAPQPSAAPPRTARARTRRRPRPAPRACCCRCATRPNRSASSRASAWTTRTC